MNKVNIKYNRHPLNYPPLENSWASVSCWIYARFRDNMNPIIRYNSVIGKLC